MIPQIERLLQPRTGSEHVKPSKDLAEPAASHSRQSVADTARPAINATPNKPIRERHATAARIRHVAVSARNDVEVRVADRLPGGLAVVDPDREAVGGEVGSQLRADPRDQREEVRELVVPYGANLRDELVSRRGIGHPPRPSLSLSLVLAVTR